MIWSQTAIDLAGIRPYGHHLTDEQLAWLRKEGVTEEARSSPWPIYFDRVVFLANDRCELERDHRGEEPSVEAMIIGVIDNREIIDLAAWDGEASRQASLLGRGFALGQEQLWAPNLERRPLPVWRNPINWLRFGRKGIVLLDKRNAWNRLDHLPGVVAEDDEHAFELARILWNPRNPIKIFTIAKTKDAA